MILETIYARRSIRKYQEKLVEEEKMWKSSGRR